MSYAERHTVALTTIADGSVTAYTSSPVTGRVISCIYTKTDFADTVDFVITSEVTLQNIWVEENVTASKVVAPRQATHDAAGLPSLYAAAGLAVEGDIVVANERIKVVISNGGDAKTGAITFIIG